MAQAFTTLGVTVDRRLHEFADSSHKAFDRLKRKSLQELVEDTKDWLHSNKGRVIVGAMTAGFLIGCLLRRSRRG